MGRLFYIINGGILDALGVRNKVSAQATSLSKYFDVTIAIVGGYKAQADDLERMTSVNIKILNKKRKIKLIQVVEDLLSVLKVTLGLNDSDIIYTRYSTLVFFIVPRNCAIITEHQTKEWDEYLVTDAFSKRQLILLKLIEKYFGILNRRLRDGFVAVTGEICDYEANLYGNKPGLIIPNGINVSAVPLMSRKAPISCDFNILGLACVSTWHGYDRVINGIRKYGGDVNVRFHIVGDGGDIQNLKRLANDLSIPHKIIFHGVKEGKELDEIVEKCHVGIGVLAPHRKNLREAASLKLREYCARGLPIVDSTIDRDFDGFPFIYQLESNEEPVDIAALIGFFNSCAAEDYPTIMRDFAYDKLDWDKKAQAIALFIERQGKGCEKTTHE